jgi:secreted PhoX family phosphatase
MMGKFSYENSLANPTEQDKTIVISTDDATPGQVYVYIGNKTNSGTEVDKAGLTNGKLFGVAVSGLTTEVSASIPSPNTSFSLIDLGVVKDSTGFQLNRFSNLKGVTNFLRPEDGAWDPNNLNDFYFVTTNAITSPSRLWKLHFNDIQNPEKGGTITALLDGTEGQKMMDNIGFDNTGNLLVQEDVGNNVHNGKIHQYNLESDKLTQIAQHDPARFESNGSNFLTLDEESSGMIDVQSILGNGNFLLVDQAHYAIGGEVVEGGQLLKDTAIISSKNSR